VDKEAASLIKEAQEMYVSKLKELSKESEGYDELQKSLGEALVRYAKSYDGFVQLAKSGKPNMSFAEYSDMMERLRADLDKIGGKPRFSL
jgi:vacuolar-type H+-ATPase subunit E/Vma4